MKTRRISDGDERSFVVVFDAGDEVIAGLTRFAEEEQLSAARLTGLGAFSDAVLGFFDLGAKDYDCIPVTEQVEVVTLVGDIALKDGRPMLHPHVVVSRRDGTTLGGHLMEAHVRPTLEVMVTETPAHLHRRIDEETGLPLLEPDA